MQLARSVQFDGFSQSYVANGQMDGIFSQILGDQNICELQKDEWLPYLELAQAGRLRAVGNVTISVSIYPRFTARFWGDTPLRFFVEGTGRYVVRVTPPADGSEDRFTDELVASADFRVVDTGPYRMEKIGEDHIDLKVSQTVVREFIQQKRRFVSPSNLVIRVKMRKIGGAGTAVYSIDRDRRHPVGLLEGETVRQIGCLKFDTPNERNDDDRKLVDLRPLGSMLLWWILADDYEKKLTSQEVKGVSLPDWTPYCGADDAAAVARVRGIVPLPSALEVKECDEWRAPEQRKVLAPPPVTTPKRPLHFPPASGSAGHAAPRAPAPRAAPRSP